jgi:hypothetical protein
MLLTTFAALQPASPLQVAEPVDVCDLFADPARYHGRQLLVRGEFFSGRHGIALLRYNCAVARNKNVSICVQDSLGPAATRVDFETVMLPLEIISETERKLREAETGFRGEAVIRGKLFVAPPGRGYCHLNNFQMLLVARELVSYSTKLLDSKEESRLP